MTPWGIVMPASLATTACCAAAAILAIPWTWLSKSNFAHSCINNVRAAGLEPNLATDEQIGVVAGFVPGLSEKMNIQEVFRMEKCVYCGRDLPEKPYKVKVHTRSFDVCCKECSEQAAHYVKQDKRFKTALYLLVFAGGLGFMFSAFFGGESPLRMIGAYIGQLAAWLAFVAFPYPGSLRSNHSAR